MNLPRLLTTPLFFLLLAAAALLTIIFPCLTPTYAQNPPAGFTPCNSQTLNVSATTSNIQLSSCGTTAVIWNIGSAEAFVAVGTASTQAATTSNLSVPGGTGITLLVNNQGEYLAAITASSTTTLRVSNGWGFPALSGGPDGSSASMPTYVTGNVGGYDSGTTPVQTATPNSSSHAAGTSVGGLFQIPIARTSGGSGEGENFLWISTGGDTSGKQLRLWDKKPTVGTTCTDQTAYVSNATDDEHLLSPPIQFTPAAPTNTTGDAKTYGSYQFIPPISFHNQDSAVTQYVYACVVTTATDTADESNPVYVDLTGPQN